MVENIVFLQMNIFFLITIHFTICTKVDLLSSVPSFLVSYFSVFKCVSRYQASDKGSWLWLLLNGCSCILKVLLSYTGEKLLCTLILEFAVLEDGAVPFVPPSPNFIIYCVCEFQ